jgi:hypothetical protein
MSCKRYQRLLQLNRPGELSERQARKLESHLGKCSACAAEKKRIAKSQRIMAAIKLTVPQLEDPEKLIAKLTKKAAQIEQVNRKKWSQQVAENLLDWLALPKVRMAYAGAVIILTSTFIAQETMIAYQVSRLEARIAQHAISTTGNELIIGDQKKLIDEVKELKARDIRQRSGSLSAGFFGRQISVNGKKVLYWIDAFKNFNQAKEVISGRVPNSLSLFKGISFKNGLDSSEINLLLDRKTEILRILSKL